MKNMFQDSSYAERQELGHNVIPKIAKMAIVIYEYSRDSESVTSMIGKMKTRRKCKVMLAKLIKTLENDFQEYNNIKGSSMSESLTILLKSSVDKMKYNIWMPQLNQWMHVIIHDLAQHYDPANKGNSSEPFFKEIHDELTEEL